ncbi:MAG: BTAD domain-containing putative transcriptional regulator [Chloroflexota bacterium]
MNESLSVTLFGSPQFRFGTQPLLGLTTGKTQALFFYLICQDGPISRELLANILWSEMVDQQARNNLRTTLHRLRQVLGSHLIVTHHDVTFNRDESYWLDIEQFRICFRTGFASGQRKIDINVLQEGIDLYSGDFIEGFHVRDAPEFDGWMMSQREQLRTEAIQTMEGLITHYLAEGHHALGLPLTDRLLTLEPWRETAHQQRMKLLTIAGQRGHALHQFESCRQILEDEFGVAPSPETVALYEVIKQGTYDNSGPDDLITPSPPYSLTPLSPLPDPYATLSRLEPLPDQKLFGAAEIQTRLRDAILEPERLWLVSLEGIGGIGKTTLAHDLTRQLVGSERFYDIGWVSAKQEEFAPDVGLQPTEHPALTATNLTDALLDQLSTRAHAGASAKEKQATLLRLLKENPYLIVIDNLETVADYKALLPLLRQYANPTKFLITSRFSLRTYTDVFCLNLTEMGQADTNAFIRYQAEARDIQPLMAATQSQLDQIYSVVGGNPLAVKLVIGQAAFLPLSQVLDSLQMAQGTEIDELYTYIYWQAWNLLDEIARVLFLAMPVIPSGTFDELAAISRLKIEQIRQALPQLIALSLVQVSGALEKRVYQLHSLTETFLMNEVLKWQPNP